MKRIIVGAVLALTAQALVGQTAPRIAPYAPLGIVSDWTHRHVLYPDSKDPSVMARIQKDLRWQQNWYLRHHQAWWPERHRRQRSGGRDWSVPLEAAPVVGFGQRFDFTFAIAPETGFGSLNTIDMGNDQFLATAGSLTVTGGADVGAYPLYPGGPGVTVSPLGAFDFDDVLYPSTNPPLDLDGLLFTGPGLEINIWGNSLNNYSFYDFSDGAYGTQLTEAGTFTLSIAPGGGQSSHSQFSLDVNSAPSCTSDFVVIGIPTNPAPGGQANIVGFNNLYSSQGSTSGTPLCGTSGPSVMFAYASGTGQVPADIVLAQNGTQIAYIENLTTGSSYFHVLTIGTTGTNGTSPTAAAVPGVGNDAVDQTVLLSPDGGVTNQSSTNTVYVVYTPGDTDDVAYATTYTTAGTGSGYLYKIGNVFNGSTPTIIWSVAIDAIPSTPVYDPVSANIFFTDSNGRIGYVTDNGVLPPVVVYSPVVASGNTAENPVIVDVTHEKVYASFNSNGTNAIVVQAAVDLSSGVVVPVGAATGIYTGPYEPNFNNAWYTGTGTPLMYVAGTGTGTLPTLYSVGFNAGGLMNSSADPITAPLATGMADSSPLIAFYNASLQKDYLFVGVTDNCIATNNGGTAGCVMSLDITNGFPTVDATTTALPAPGGTTGMVVDNDSTLDEASSIYYATKTAATLVKATQSGLN
jgi:hypothetical protein